jgi:serralysin
MVAGLIPKTSNYNVSVRIYAWNTIANIQRGYGADGNVANALLYKGAARSLIENAVGGAGADDITSNQGANVLRGSGGNDKISGLAGNETVYGGNGADQLVGAMVPTRYPATQKQISSTAAAGQGQPMATAVKAIGVTEQSFGTSFSTVSSSVHSEKLRR